MADEPRPTSDGDSARPKGDRLESWKEIAAYLRRDVRTVQRWEQTDGLPIHRHQRAHRAIPYAYARELDAWWTRRSGDSPPLQAETVPRQRQMPRALFGAIAAVALAVLAAVSPWVAHGRRALLATSAGARPSSITTSSPKALKLFQDADDLLKRNISNQGAETLLRSAIAADPAFASAHMWLAWAVRREGRPPEDYLPYVARAEALAPGASESERMFILASSLEMRGELEKSCQAYRAVLLVDPGHYWAANNGANCSASEGDRVGMADVLSRYADTHPDSLDANVRAAWADEFLVGNASKAKPFINRAEQLQGSGAYSDLGYPDPWLRLRRGYVKWLRNDVDGALNELTAVVSRDADRLQPAAQDDLYTFAGSFMLTLGRLTDAETLFNRGVQKNGRAGYLALTAYARGNMGRARHLFADYIAPGPTVAMIVARIGLEDRAREVLAGNRAPAGSSYAEGILGELAFASRDLRAATEHLTQAVRVPHGDGPDFVAAEALANTLTMSKRPAEAIEVLETATLEREHAYDPFTTGPLCGYYWLRVRLLQAELLARQGRSAESHQIASELVQLLSRADSDFPILARARQLSTTKAPVQR